MRKTVISLVLLAVGVIAGCTSLGDHVLTVWPLSGHPPLDVVVTLSGPDGTTYLIEIGIIDGDEFIVQRSFADGGQNRMTITLYELPCDIRITPDRGVGETFRVGLTNEAPEFCGWPRVNGIDPFYNALTLHELNRYLFDFNFYDTGPMYPGDPGKQYGVVDPEGDDWSIVNVEIFWYGAGFDAGRKVSVYTPPVIADSGSVDFGTGLSQYHATISLNYRSIIDNAFIVYPPYLGNTKNKSGRLECYAPEWTYWWDSCSNKTIPASQPAPLTIFVEIEDEYGAHSEKTFEFVMDATGCAP